MWIIFPSPKDYDELLSDINERETKLHAMQRLLGSINQDIKDIKNKGSMLNKEASGLRANLRQENAEFTTTESEVRIRSGDSTFVQAKISGNWDS